MEQVIKEIRYELNEAKSKASFHQYAAGEQEQYAYFSGKVEGLEEAIRLIEQSKFENPKQSRQMDYASGLTNEMLEKSLAGEICQQCHEIIDGYSTGEPRHCERCGGEPE